jgi:retron-type reverse transcriptase
MKTHNQLWQKIYDFESLLSAFHEAARGKRYRRSALEFSFNLEENLIGIQNDLLWGSYTPRPLREFWINDPKRRLISAPDFRDRDVHHSLVATIEPHFERRFIFDSHACRKGHGVQLAVRRVQDFERQAGRQGRVYYFKGDIHSYFPSIHHDVLKRIIRRVISDKNALALTDLIIDTYRPGPRGLPIGALPSQLFANVYLDQLDHHVKDRMSLRWYARYMDDFVLIHNSKHEIRDIAAEIDRFIRCELALELNPKSTIASSVAGLPFCGHRIWPTHVLIRKSTLRRASRRLRKVSKLYAAGLVPFARARASIMSLIALASHAKARATTKSILDRTPLKGGTT